MTDEPAAALAQRLLDAQVDWVLAELTGDRFRDAVARDVGDVFDLGTRLVVADVIDADAVKQAARRLVDVIGGSALVADLLPAVADAIYDSSAGEDHLLGDVVARESVEALVAKVLTMHQLQDRAMERLAESPLVATIATRYVTKIVGDFLQANREQAEKLPGVSSLFSVGLGAASKMRGVADKRLGSFLGDAQNRSTQFAIRRSNGALREILRDAPAQDAAMEIWDLQAEEPLSALREYLTAQDLRDLLAIGYEIVVDARNLDVVNLLLDECIDVFFDRYGRHDLTALLAELGFTPDTVATDVRAFAPPVIEAAMADGRLPELVRSRLEPFYRSDATLTLLAGGAPPSALKQSASKQQATTRPKPASKKS